MNTRGDKTVLSNGVVFLAGIGVAVGAMLLMGAERVAPGNPTVGNPTSGSSAPGDSESCELSSKNLCPNGHRYSADADLHLLAKAFLVKTVDHETNQLFVHVVSFRDDSDGDEESSTDAADGQNADAKIGEKEKSEGWYRPESILALKVDLATAASEELDVWLREKDDESAANDAAATDAEN